MDDLLKDAIADAKAVRETALANAKMALEEAFTPKLKSMLAQKIQSEIEDEGEDHGDMEDEGSYDDEIEDKGDMEDEIAYEEEGDEDEVAEIEDDGDHEDEIAEEEGDEDHEDEIAEIEDDEEKEESVNEEDEDEEIEEADDLDLESILRELEEEEGDEDHEDEIAEIEENEEIEENDVSSGIGKGDNKHDAKSGDSSKVGQGPEGEGSDKAAGKELGDHEVVDDLKEGEDKDDDIEEEIDLEEVLKALSEEEDEDETHDEVANLKNEIKEHRDVVKYLRAKLNEVNLLNAKLLFSNKLFRTFGLTNEQKMKVVETFDRTKNLREIKLVYSTLAESFGQTKVAPIKESVRKGSSSKAVASTKPSKKVISEGDDLKNRFKKLANII